MSCRYYLSKSYDAEAFARDFRKEQKAPEEEPWVECGIRSDEESLCRQPDGRNDQDNVPLVLAIGARRGAVLMENLTHTSKPSLHPSAHSHCPSYALRQLQSQNARRHESR